MRQRGDLGRQVPVQRRSLLEQSGRDIVSVELAGDRLHLLDGQRLGVDALQGGESTLRALGERGDGEQRPAQHSPGKHVSDFHGWLLYRVRNTRPGTLPIAAGSLPAAPSRPRCWQGAAAASIGRKHEICETSSAAAHQARYFTALLISLNVRCGGPSGASM